ASYWSCTGNSDQLSSHVNKRPSSFLPVITTCSALCCGTIQRSPRSQPASCSRISWHKPAASSPRSCPAVMNNVLPPPHSCQPPSLPCAGNNCPIDEAKAGSAVTNVLCTGSSSSAISGPPDWTNASSRSAVSSPITFIAG